VIRKEDEEKKTEKVGQVPRARPGESVEQREVGSERLLNEWWLSMPSSGRQWCRAGGGVEWTDVDMQAIGLPC